MASCEVAVVSGSNKGIGYEIVRALCSKFDGDVFLTSRSVDRGKEAIQKLTDEGFAVKYHELDIEVEESIYRLKDYMMENYGGINVLVNNAGTAFKHSETMPFATQAKVTIGCNFFGTLHVSNILLPIIKSNGRVVNVSSMVSSLSLNKCKPELQEEFRSDTITEEQLIKRMKEFIASAGKGTHVEDGWPNTAYGVSKLGVTVMSRIHARWLREQGKNDILLNACCPGWVRTDMAGHNAPKSPAEGAETPVYLALLPTGASEPHGELVSEENVQPW